MSFVICAVFVGSVGYKYDTALPRRVSIFVGKHCTLLAGDVVLKPILKLTSFEKR